MGRAWVIVAASLTVGGCLAAPDTQPPKIEFRTDESQDRIVVVTADGRAHWSRVWIRVTDCGPDEGHPILVHVGSAAGRVNAAATQEGPVLNRPTHPGFCAPGVDVPLSLLDFDPVHRHDFVSFCVAGAGAAGAHDVGLFVWDKPTGHRYGGAWFSNAVRACPALR